MTLMDSTLKPAIWSCDSSQQMACFDSCQLTMKWISNIKVNQGKGTTDINHLVNRQAKGAMLRDSVCTYAHAMRGEQMGLTRMTNEKQHAWVSYFNAWFSLVYPISLGRGLCIPSGRRSSAIIRKDFPVCYNHTHMKHYCSKVHVPSSGKIKQNAPHQHWQKSPVHQKVQPLSS